MKSLKQILSALFFTSILLSQNPFPHPAHAAPKKPVNGFSDLAPGFYDHALGSPVIDLIENTQSTLEIEIYEMNGPKVIQAIRKALKRGVKVRIVKEPVPVGASCRVFEAENAEKKQEQQDNSQTFGASTCEEQKQLLTEVIASGGAYVPFDKKELCKKTGGKNCLQHGKLVISDAKKALLSTGNFNITSLCHLEFAPEKCNRDFSFISAEADVIQSFRNVFEKDLAGDPYFVEDVVVPSAESKITIGPNALTPLLSFIRTAKKHIWVENQYLKDPTINQALIDAAQNGVKVRVILASACSFGKPKPNEAKKLTTLFTAFEKAGIELKMFNKKIKVGGKPGYQHAKALVIDGTKAWVGSVNGSTQALTANREFGIFFDQPVEVLELVTRFQEDFVNPHQETWQESLVCKENQP